MEIEVDDVARLYDELDRGVLDCAHVQVDPVKPLDHMKENLRRSREMQRA